MVLGKLAYLSTLGLFCAFLGSDNIMNANSRFESSAIESKIAQYENYAVILVDMQEGWEDDSILSDVLKAWKWEEKVKNQQKVLQFAKERNIPVVFLELFNSGSGETLSRLEDTVEGNYKRFEKVGQSGFYQTVNRDEKKTEDGVLERYLKSVQAKKLIIMGNNKYECVYATAFEGVEKGFQIISSGDLLIGGNFPGLEIHPIWQERVDKFYEQKVKYYGSVDELLDNL